MRPPYVRFVITILFLAMSCEGVDAQSPSSSERTSIFLHLKGSAKGQKPFITGSSQDLGNWNPSVIEMEQISDSVFVFMLTRSSTEAVHYKFTLGSWEKEAKDGNGKIFENQTIASNEKEVHHHVFGWGTTAPIASQVTGEVRIHESIQGSGLAERDVIVWLPPGYDDLQETVYPVLYMHDGQNIFDPSTSFMGVDWQVDETVDLFITERIIDPMIIVGIYNTADRSEEYLDEIISSKYKNLVIETIKPMIDQVYRTSRDAQLTFTAGSSAGGTLAFMLAWEHPDVFGGAMCFSPAFIDPDPGSEGFDYLDDIRLSAEPSNARFYLYNGGVGLEKKLQPGIDEAIRLLESKGLQKDKDFFFHKDEAAEHDESAWSKDFGLGLLWMLGKDC
ncbi:MAG: alpha/beta hydrolase-fold protein [Cryomorphaceae bacterium]